MLLDFKDIFVIWEKVIELGDENRFWDILTVALERYVLFLIEAKFNISDEFWKSENSK